MISSFFTSLRGSNVHIQNVSFLILCSFRRYFGIVISHFQVAIFTARCVEIADVVQATLFYMNPDAPIPVHSPYSALPYEVSDNYMSKATS